MELCDDRGIRLFSDEVYRGLELDPRRPSPRPPTCSPTALSLNVMSKAYGLPGLRIGWLACRDRALLERLERRKHYTSICNAGPSEFLGTDRPRQRRRDPRPQPSDHRGEPSALRRVLRPLAGATSHGSHPHGGCVALPAADLGPTGPATFCRRLVETAGVLLLPADIYRVRRSPTSPRTASGIGVGRRDPDPALAAFDGFLRREG